jgi:hypothetical protein
MRSAVLVWQVLGSVYGVLGLLYFAFCILALTGLEQNRNDQGLGYLFVFYLLVFGGPLSALSSALLFVAAKRVLKGRSYSRAVRAARWTPGNAVGGVAVLLPLIVLFIPAAIVVYVLAKAPMRLLERPGARALYAED